MLSTMTGVYPIADARIRVNPGARLLIVYRPSGFVVTVVWVPSTVTRTPWSGRLSSARVMTPVIRPTVFCARTRVGGAAKAAADHRPTARSRRFIVRFSKTVRPLTQGGEGDPGHHRNTTVGATLF